MLQSDYIKTNYDKISNESMQKINKTLLLECKKINFTAPESFIKPMTEGFTFYDAFDRQIPIVNSRFENFIGILSELKGLKLKSGKTIDNMRYFSELSLSEIELEVKATDENITLLNYIFRKNADILTRVFLTLCYDDEAKTTVSLDMSPLAKAYKLEILSVNADKAEVMGINHFPKDVKYLHIIGNHKETVDLSAIPKAAFEVEFNGKITIGKTYEIFPNLLYLRCSNSGITDDTIKLIPKIFPNLRGIDLSDSISFTNVEPLSELKDLFILSLDNTFVNNAKQFENFKNLIQLQIANTNITSIKPLYSLPKLAIVLADSSKKLFNDEILDVDDIIENNRFVISFIDKFPLKKLESSSGKYDKDSLDDYVCNKLKDNTMFNMVKESFIRRGNFTADFFNLYCDEVSYCSYYSLDTGKRDLSEVNMYLTIYPDFSRTDNIRSIDVAYKYTKSLCTLSEKSKPKLLRIGDYASEKIFKILKQKNSNLDEVETFIIYASYNSLSFSDFNELNLNNVKNISLEAAYFNGDFCEKEGIEHLYIESNNRQSEIRLNLDKMPNLKSLTLIGVKPAITAAKPHKALKNITIKKCCLSSIDDIFSGECDTAVLAPAYLDVSDNLINTFSSKYVDLTETVILNVGDNAITDKGVVLLPSFKKINIEENPISYLKSKEIKDFLFK